MSRVMKIDVADPAERDIVEIAAVIKAGGVIVYPTETLYGIGANALSHDAVRRVVNAKQRPDDKPILVLVHEPESLDSMVEKVPDAAKILMKSFWPGPLTLVFPARAGMSEAVTKSAGTIGIRIPSSEFCRKLVAECGCPLTSTSANIAGRPTFPTIDEIKAELGDSIDLYVDAGRLPDSLPSTVIDVTVTPPVILRAGAIEPDQIRRRIPDVR